jgi:glycosyltransferase involved in cell wall biosynthesis
MGHGTPVITYKNSSLPEVGGSAVIYADNYQGIADSIEELLNNKTLRKKYSDAGLAQSEKFSWAKTSEQILKLLSSS